MANNALRMGMGSLAALAAIFSTTAARTETTLHISALVPMNGPSRVVGATRTEGMNPRDLAPDDHPVNTWTKLVTLPGVVVHDVAFESPTVGFAAAELGQVWKTSNGGKTWKAVLNRGFPYYYYGIAVNGHTVTASGFDDSNSEGILTQSTDGGKHWDADTVLSTNAWAGRVRFVHGLKDGLVMNGEGLANPNAAWWSVASSPWTQVTPDSSGGWFGYQFTLLKDQTAYASGINFCTSADTGASWTCGPPADSVFDGPTLFVSDTTGWTGGGEISPSVEGWLHRTTDGGKTWSGRVLNAPWPIRQIEFLNAKIGWAAGGDIYSNVGGIYYSADGGKTWSLDVNSGDEVGACAHENLGNGQTQVWCIADAYNGNFVSNVYSTVVSTP